MTRFQPAIRRRGWGAAARPLHRPPVPSSVEDPNGSAARIRLGLILILQTVMALELMLLLGERLWASSFWLLAIMAITAAPAVFGRRLPVRVPPEYDVFAILFVFAALFLGEFRSYYSRLWWWDVALHATSGLLLGVVGFLLVYVLNESRRIDLHMRPGFVALFAFAFAVAGGTTWEIFEYAMDQFFGTTMQKPMLGDSSGLTDTMWDLIVDGSGAAAVSSYGWWSMRREGHSILEAWIEKFLERNPHLFRGTKGESHICELRERG